MAALEARAVTRVSVSVTRNTDPGKRLNHQPVRRENLRFLFRRLSISIGVYRRLPAVQGFLRFLSQALAGCLVLGQAAPGYGYPDRPLSLILPFPWTGSTDIAGVPRLSRLATVMQTLSPPLTDYLVQQVQQSIAATLGQPVHVYRRVHGKTNIGTRYVATAAPDGYTLLFADNPTITVAPVRNPGLRTDPVKDLVPVAAFAHMPIAMVAASGPPVPRVREIIERARRLPDSINYASAGGGTTSHLIGELFRAMSDAKIVHVSYNGSLAALGAIVTSQIEIGFVPLAAVLPFLDGGKVKLMAVGSAARHPILPNVPTIGEAGIPGFAAGGWFGVFAPARTPGVIVSLLNYEINKALSEESLQRALIAQGLLPAPGTAEDFRARVEKDRARWAQLLKTIAVSP